MGNQPSSPASPTHPRSRSATPSHQAQPKPATSIKTHRSLRKRNRSIELPDLDPGSVPFNARRVSSHGIPTPVVAVSSRRKAAGAAPIPIGGLDPRHRTDSDAERLLGGDYGKHIPPEVVARATTITPPPYSASERRKEMRREQENKRMESLLAEVVNRDRLYTTGRSCSDSDHSSQPSTNEAYRRDVFPPRAPSPPHTPVGEIFHSKLRFGLNRHVLMNAGILPRSESLEAANATSSSDFGMVNKPASFIDPDTGAVLGTSVSSDETATTPVLIQYSEPCEAVILCLYNSQLVGLGFDVNSIGLEGEGLEGREADGLYIMDKTTDASGKPLFVKALHLNPGTHHMRFLVSTASSRSSIDSSLPLSPDSHPGLASSPASPGRPSTPTSKASHLVAKVSSSLPTSPDPSGHLANFVVVSSASMPLSNVKPTIQIPHKLRGRLMEIERRGGREPGHSFWSKDSEAEADDLPSSGNPVTDDIENVKREEKVERWTSEIPEELQAAARAEEEHLASVVAQQQEQMQLQAEREAHAQRGGEFPTPGAQQISGFQPAPPTPVPLMIPRHLDKLILNYRAPPPSHPRENSPSNSPTRGGHRQAGSERDSARHHRSSRLRERTPEATIREEGRPDTIPATAASGADASGTAMLSTTANAAAALTSASSFLSSTHGVALKPFASTASPLARGLTPANYQAGAPTKMDLMSGTGMTDDGSVLPVPSHVVLNHLCTSSIKNSVLAVGTTLRYKEKYVTAVYYKPTGK